jgi:hypothetical protein
LVRLNDILKPPNQATRSGKLHAQIKNARQCRAFPQTEGLSIQRKLPRETAYIGWRAERLAIDWPVVVLARE